LLARVNQESVIGNWQINLDTGQIFYITSIKVSEASLTFASLDNLVNANITSFDRYLPIITEAIEKEMTPTETIPDGEAIPNASVQPVTDATPPSLPDKPQEDENADNTPAAHNGAEPLQITDATAPSLPDKPQEDENADNTPAAHNGAEKLQVLEYIQRYSNLSKQKRSLIYGFINRLGIDATGEAANKTTRIVQENLQNLQRITAQIEQRLKKLMLEESIKTQLVTLDREIESIAKQLNNCEQVLQSLEVD
jgi:hypothetical protein